MNLDIGLGERPPPPPLPKYDPNEEAPKWNWARIWHELPVDKGSIPWTPVGTQPDSPDKPDWRGVIRNEVIELPMPEPYKFGHYNDPKYFWFDTPDYADPFKKLGYSFRFFSMAGFGFSTLYGWLTGMKFSVPNNIKLFKMIFGPVLVAGMGGSAAVITLANIRDKKDDMYNYFWGGIVAGSIMGRKSSPTFFKWNVVLPPAAIFAKYNAETNGELMPRFNPRLIKGQLSGSDAQHGIASGDLRLGLRTSHGDPGRDVRTPY